jgi:predicted enzyme related to lactoylglutathione lyase
VGINRVVPNVTTDRVDESRKFYTDPLGFQIAMDMDWIVTLASSDNPTAQISLVRGERADPANATVTLTIEVDDVDKVHADAVSGGHDIVYPLTDESWRVRRFHLMDPNGVVINVMSHLE